MKDTIEITISRNADGHIWACVQGENCTRQDIQFVALAGAVSLVVNDLDKNIPDAGKRRLAETFGDMVGQMMLGVLTGKTATQRAYEGKDAEFLHALMKRQGEVQK